MSNACVRITLEQFNSMKLIAVEPASQYMLYQDMEGAVFKFCVEELHEMCAQGDTLMCRIQNRHYYV